MRTGIVQAVAFALLSVFVSQAPAATLFTEDFESPVVTGKKDFNQQAVPGWINDYSGSYPQRTGFWNEDSGDFITPNGAQAAWVWMHRQLTTTNITDTLQLSTTYTIDFYVGAARANNTPGTVNYELQLLAGTSVVTIASGSINDTNLANNAISHEFTTGASHANAGETLAIRLHMSSGPWNTQVLFDDIVLSAVSVSDTNAPSPDPSGWLLKPAADVNGSISMIAAEAMDPSGVEYFFTNTINGNVSGWQSDRSWTDAGLSNGVSYSYRVKTRDLSTNFNATAWSPIESATSDASILYAEHFELPAISGKHEYNVTAVPGWINDYSGGYPERTGFWNEDSGDFITDDGEQAAWVWFERQLTSTNVNTVLELSTEYTISFDVGAAQAGTNPAPVNYELQLLAGSNLVTSTSGTIGNTNMTDTAIVHVFTTGSSHANEGQALQIRLLMPSGPYQTQVLYDNIVLSSSPVSDTTPPSPSTSAWLLEPHADTNSTISMIASLATDPSGVQYFFTNTVNGDVSGWQNSRIWTNAGLVVGQPYGYRVKTRDLSINFNETAWSPEETASVDPSLIFTEHFELPPISGKNEFNVTPVPGWTNDYSGDYARRTGFWNVDSGDFLTPDGEQASWVWLDRQLTTLDFGQTLLLNNTYEISFFVGAAKEGATPGTVDYEVQLMAGSNLVTSASGSIGDTNLASTAITHDFTVGASHTNQGESLSIRLLMPSGPYQTQVLYDRVQLRVLPPVSTLYRIR